MSVCRVFKVKVNFIIQDMEIRMVKVQDYTGQSAPDRVAAMSMCHPSQSVTKCSQSCQTIKSFKYSVLLHEHLQTKGRY